MITGLPRFPCSPSKRPLSSKGFYDATSNPINEDRWPLTGVPTGAVSGLDVLDIDPAGSAWLDQNFDALPLTRAHSTRRDGLHLLFRHAEGLRCSAGRIAPGVDIRAEGGFIIWWPREGLPFEDWPICQWPDWLLKEALGGNRRTWAASSETLEWAAAIADHRKTVARWSAQETIALYACSYAGNRVRQAPFGARSATLNKQTFELGQYVGAGALECSRVAVTTESAMLLNAARDESGRTFVQERGVGDIRKRILRALAAGMANPRMPVGKRPTRKTTDIEDAIAATKNSA